MSERPFVLLVHGHPEPLESLKRMLEDLPIETYSVNTSHEAADLIARYKPHIIFTETVLRDGSWQNILRVAEAVDVPLNVIVVGTIRNIESYVSVIDQGAFDFIAPPFDRANLSLRIQMARRDARRRMEVTTLAAAAS